MPQERRNPMVEKMARRSLRAPTNSDMIDFQILRASRSPGPQDYSLPDLSASVSGGRLGRTKSKGFIELEQDRAAMLPGPADYKLQGIAETTSGGRLSKTKAKSTLEWVEYHEKSKPGPADYEKKPYSLTHGALDKEEGNATQKWDEKRSRSIPGPQYDLDRSWNYVLPSRGGNLGQASKSKSMLEWIQYRAIEDQAPTTQYDVERSYSHLEPTWRQGLKMRDYNLSKRYIDLYVEPQARAQPGPASYDVSAAYDHLEGRTKSWRNGGNMASRPFVGQLPAPFASLSMPNINANSLDTTRSTLDIRLEPSRDHNKTLTPWRREEVPPPADDDMMMGNDKPKRRPRRVRTAPRAGHSGRCGKTWLTRAAFKARIYEKERPAREAVEKAAREAEAMAMAAAMAASAAPTPEAGEKQEQAKEQV